MKKYIKELLSLLFALCIICSTVVSTYAYTTEQAINTDDLLPIEQTSNEYTQPDFLQQQSQPDTQCDATETIVLQQKTDDDNVAQLQASDISPTSVQLNKSSMTMGKGEKYTLKSTLTPSTATTALNWSSNNTAVVQVDKTGVITAKAVGTATVTVKTSNSKTATCKITVKNAPTSVALNKTSLTLNIGESFDLNSTLPSGTASYSVVYSSDNTSVASVKSAGGLVTAQSVGTAVITAKTFNGKTATCKVTVVRLIQSIALNRTSMTMGKGETYTLKLTLTPPNATSNYTWNSSNATVAYVNQSGTITAKSVGTATITIKSDNQKTATCKITVKNAPNSISLNKTSLTMGIGETYDLNSTLPSGTASSSIVYTSSNPTVAPVKSAGGLVTAQSVGTAVITAKTFNGKTATCKITVKKAPTSFKLNKESLVLKIGETFDLDSCFDSNSASAHVTYTSNNSSIASVKASGGLVTAHAFGIVTITATAFNGITAKCDVTVTGEIESISLNKTSLTMGKGETYTLKVTPIPYGAVTVYSWNSSNTSAASISSAGVISAKAVGTTTVTVTSQNKKTATCQITVKNAPNSISLNKTSLTMGIGETYDLNSTLPSGTASSSIVYTSSNPTVAPVKSAGGLVTAQSVGTAVITAKTFNGKTATCKITVKKAPTSFTLNKTSLKMYIGESFDLNSCFESNAASSYVMYKSDNPFVASVQSSGGLVTATAMGSATITATTYNGLTATCKVQCLSAYNVTCIDISHWQDSNIDFKKVKAAGIQAVIIRAGYGKETYQKDANFETFYNNAKAAGLKVGAYWYSYADSVTASKQEAATCLSCIKGKTFDLPIYYDMEDDRQTKYSKTTLTNVAIAFCEAIKSGGYRAGVYSNLNWFTNYLDYNTLRSKYSIWYAQYYRYCEMECDIWQNSCTGRVDGIYGDVDTSVIYNPNVIQ